jgi:hypothetical protein
MRLLLPLLLALIPACKQVTTHNSPPIDQAKALNQQTSTVLDAIQDEATIITPDNAPQQKHIISTLAQQGQHTVSQVDQVLDQVDDAVQDKDQQITDQQQQIDALTSTSWSSRVWILIQVVSSLALIASIPLFIWVDKKVGVSLAVVALASIGIAQFMMAYAWILTIVAGIGLLAVIGLAGWSIYKHRNAIKQIVLSVEDTKPALQPEQLQAFKDAANRQQSAVTQQLVDAAKA